jgi:hypothetical protein
VEISHCRHVRSYVLSEQYCTPNVRYSHGLAACDVSLAKCPLALVSCSHYADWRFSCRLLDAQTWPDVQRRSAAACRRLSVLTTKAMELPEMSGWSYQVWSPRSTLQTHAFTLRHPCTVAHLHTCALAHWQHVSLVGLLLSLSRRKESQLNSEMLCFRLHNAESTDSTFWN